MSYERLEGQRVVMQLRWLPEADNWRERLKALPNAADLWMSAVALANCRLDFARTNALDEILRRCGLEASTGGGTKPVRLGVLGSSTLAHLHAGIRVAGVRRHIHISTYENDYGQYMQELLDQESGLYQFRPNCILFAFDAYHITRGLHAGLSAAEVDIILENALLQVQQCWSSVRETFSCSVMQQTVLNVFAPLLGSNEHRLPGSRSHFVVRFNEGLRALADGGGVSLIALDDAARRDGLNTWHNPALWHRSKQEVTPALSPTYGELVARAIAAGQGRSYKCLILDLDNTIWGGVIGDDGLDGIVLGQGSAMGEGFVAVQEYAKDLSRRGIILAVSSKNDESNAMEPFTSHPEMVLRLTDIASFRASWQDKVTNIRAIATDLNIGLDSLVFLDDNPFERTLVREELPMVAVPEVPDFDPGRIPGILADAGYFESLGVTADDRGRASQYQENRAREQLRTSSTDISSYLRALNMQLLWSRFDAVGLKRIVQLINKTNQFNLTTRRYDENDISALMSDPTSIGLQIRLTDRFGDNGIISIVIARARDPHTMVVDTWLMSCRVLGRGVERATLNLLAEQASSLGATRLVGEYFPTKKNAMVRDHYANLGFEVETTTPDGSSSSTLYLEHYVPTSNFVQIVESNPG